MNLLHSFEISRLQCIMLSPTEKIWSTFKNEWIRSKWLLISTYASTVPMWFRNWMLSYLSNFCVLFFRYSNLLFSHSSSEVKCLSELPVRVRSLIHTRTSGNQSTWCSNYTKCRHLFILIYGRQPALWSYRISPVPVKMRILGLSNLVCCLYLNTTIAVNVC